MNGFHKARIVPQDECKSEIEIESDADIVNNWQHLCQKLGAELHWVTIGVGNDVIVVQELTDYILSEIVMGRNGACGDNMTLEGEGKDDEGDENVITIAEATNTAL